MNLTLNVTLTTPEVTVVFFEGLCKLHKLQAQTETLTAQPPVTPVNPTQLAAPTLNTYAAAPTAPQTPPVVQVAPVAATAPMGPIPTDTTASPVTPAVDAAPAAPAQMPTAPVAPAPTYTFDDLARAAAPLMDAGKTADLQALLRSFGVQALTQLPKEQYGAFATSLRGLGARL